MGEKERRGNRKTKEAVTRRNVRREHTIIHAPIYRSHTDMVETYLRKSSEMDGS